jgi:membrane-anchored mycosin MYCP
VAALALARVALAAALVLPATAAAAPVAPGVATPALAAARAVPVGFPAAGTGPSTPPRPATASPLVRCTPPAATSPGSEPVGRAPAERLRLSAAHALATGRGQRIAVIDTGVAPHPRLAGRLVGLGDFLAGGDGLDDCDGHGTAVAGLIGAAADPRDDLVGVAPEAQILAVRQFSPSIAGDAAHPTGDLPSLAAAVTWAVRRGATVVNISGAVCVPRDRAASVGAPVRAALELAARADVVVVAAAGNVDGGGCAADDATQVSLPGWFGDDLLTVGAVGPDDRPAAFTVPGPWVDVAAPGTDVRSLTVDGGTGPPLDGTSFAAPYVAGLAALVRERRPDLTAHEVADRIAATAHRPATGRDDAVGYGIVDPVAALTAEPAVLHPGEPARPVATVLRPSAPAPTAPAWPIAVLVPLLAAVTAALRPRRP